MPTDRELIEYEIARRKTLEPLRYFVPNGAQEKFIQAIAEPESRIIVFAAGNWIGKTAAAMADLAAIMWPKQAEHPCFKNKVHKEWDSFGWPKRARIVSTPKELETIGSIQTEIKRWWPAGRYQGDKKGKSYDSQFATNTGWTIDLLTYDMDTDQFEGATISYLVFNEPPPEKIFNACLARMKYGGKVVMPMTPLTGSAWIYDRLVANEGKQGIRIIYGATEENCIEHGHNGVIPHKAIQALSDSCDPDDREARLEGKFMHLAGQIFKTFKRDVHTFKLESVDGLLSGKEIFQVVDPAIGKPIACLWSAQGHDGVLYIYDEYPEFEFQGAKDSNMTVQDYAVLFKAKEEGRRVNCRILDRHFGNVRRTLGGLTLKQEFAEHGIEFIDSYSIADNATEIETGILRVKDLLRYNTAKPIDSLNRPRLMVADHCINTIHALERWRRDEKNGKPKEEYKDFSDCIRYLGMFGPEPERERDWDVEQPYYGVGN